MKGNEHVVIASV